MRVLTPSLLIAALLLPMPVAASGGSSSSETTPAQTPEQLAAEYYDRGLKFRDKAWELEKRLEGNGKAAKLQSKIEGQWNKAVGAYREAIDNDPTMHQAHSSLGYAYRKLGRYEESLGAYNRALELEPTYVEAIEYRAEAYLGLGRLEDAKAAYVELFGMDREQADILMTAMREWIEKQESSEEVDEFSAWVEERSEIAGQTAMLIQSQGRSW